MKKQILVFLGLSVFALNAVAQAPAAAPTPPPMGFFVTSVGKGDGANLGGLAGADAHCQALAEAVGSTRTWHAYLSAKPAGNMGAVNARDRIGTGPWANAKGVVVADNLDTLHYDNSLLNYTNSLNEKGGSVNSASMNNLPNTHDILTGSNLDGTLIDAEDGTCSNWTSNAAEGNAAVGHHDRYRGTTPGSAWNYNHLSRGCSQANLVSSGGAGLFYCFAID